MDPTYEFRVFKEACKEGKKKVTVMNGAKETARSDFGLNTEEAVISFIGNDGLEEPKFERTKPWKNNPNPKHPIMVDSYGFYSGNLHGYIAFLFSTLTNRWAIKSFKKNSNPDLRHMPFKDLKSLTH